MRRVVVSAPGKVILMGEHAVVYGRPAVVVAINKRCRAWINDGVVTVESDIPLGKHLGSSAAWAVARMGAIVNQHLGELSLELINELAYEMERVHHGTPSGIDNTVSTYGGGVWFQKGKGMKRLELRNLERLKHFWLVDTGKPQETTREMVEWVNGKWRMKNGKLQEILNENEIQTKKVQRALEKGDEQLLMEAIRGGEKTLEELGVVSEMACEIVRRIEGDGGAAKILGGGGRRGAVGMMLVYHPDPGKILDAPVERVQFEREGVRREGESY